MATDSPAAAAAAAEPAAAAAACLEDSASAQSKKKHRGVGDDIACLEDLSDVAVAPFGVSARQIVKMTEVRSELLRTSRIEKRQREKEGERERDRERGRERGRDRERDRGSRGIRENKRSRRVNEVD